MLVISDSPKKKKKKIKKRRQMFLDSFYLEKYWI